MRRRDTGCIALALASLVAAIACSPDAQHKDQDGLRGGVRADQQAVRRVDRYEWLAGSSAPRGCPMWFVSGDFHFPGGDSLYVAPESRLNSGWGTQLSTDVVGDEQKPIPDRIDVLFFSYLEDKFYHGTFSLPRDSIARLFREGYRSNQEPAGRATYQFLIAGVAPGGAVAVWASGAERQTEVFFGQAEAVDLDWHRALDMPADVDRRSLIESELADASGSDPLVRAMMAHVPVGRWAAYRARYRWRPVFEGMSAPERVEPVQFFNGERDYFVLPLAPTATPAGLPVPSYMSFDDRKAGRSYEITFDGDETLAAFARAGAGNQAVELVLAARSAAAAGEPALEVHVRSAAATVALRKVKVEVVGRG